MTFYKSKTLLAGVVFPQIERFFTDYFLSVKKQDCKQFDILIVNDGLKDFNFPEKPDTHIIENNCNLSPSALRMEIINYAVDNDYDYLIFSDCDDYYDINRVSRTIETLINADIAVTQLSCVSEKGDMLAENILNCEDFTELSVNRIFKHNIIGMSHSAIKIDDALLKSMDCPEDILAFDWWFYSIMLSENKSVGFIPDSRTYYRQFSSNFVGYKSLIDEKKLKNGIQVKMIHYKNLKLYLERRGKKKLVKSLAQLYDEMVELETQISDKSFLNNYLKVINKNINMIYRGWWSEILSVKEWEQYV